MELRQLLNTLSLQPISAALRVLQARPCIPRQSSVSKNISMLEEELGVTLLSAPPRCFLTAAGNFHDQAHAILQNARLMKQMDGKNTRK